MNEDSGQAMGKGVLHPPERFLMTVGPSVFALLIRVYLGLCRMVRVEGDALQREALSRSGGRAVFVTWHQRMLMLARYFGPRRLTIMISQSRDGEYGARIAAKLGFSSVRGSSTRGGMRALRLLSKAIREGACGGMLADGPQGPPRVAKVGTVLSARDAGVPIIPVVWSADRCWVLNSWDRYMIPKPFARVAVYYGEPIWVPPRVRGEALEGCRRLLEDRLNELARMADAHFGTERPWRRVKDGETPGAGHL